MGKMLAQIHWGGTGYDARDVEFVVADAAAMSAYDRVAGDVSELVDAFFANDPYYPRPVSGDALYDTFKRGYIGACPSESRERAALFLQAKQAHHAEGSPTVSLSVHRDGRDLSTAVLIWIQDLRALASAEHRSELAALGQ
ncbi:hypothetical protein LXA43DRAFT_1058561 [Ganoderma leucocontextum]|nr:hypothetical protein LXA43DRAFT_1058561 [Ganoderma leucocontextum]